MRLVSLPPYNDLWEGPVEPIEGADQLWADDTYQVEVTIKLSLYILSVSRKDGEPIHNWADLQRIKNELCGEEWEAVELYPAESRKIDTANKYHLWCLRGFPMIGWHKEGKDEVVSDTVG